MINYTVWLPTKRTNFVFNSRIGTGPWAEYRAEYSVFSIDTEENDYGVIVAIVVRQVRMS